MVNLGCCCYSQNNGYDFFTKRGYISRGKADYLLSRFDSIQGKRILYSLQDKYYYLIIQQDSIYKEYAVKTDSIGNVLILVKIDHNQEIEKLSRKKFLSKKKRRLLEFLKEGRNTIREAFDTSQYKREFITNMPNASHAEGYPSYFVMKDEYNNRYGEYSLFSFTVPCPIKMQLWVYLIRECTAQIYLVEQRNHTSTL